MKLKLSHGSALLLVFIISFIVSLAAMRCWHVSSLMCDVQYQRELFYKRFYMTNRILNAGIDLACKNFDIFLKLGNATDVDVNFCLTEAEIKNANTARFSVSGVALKAKESSEKKIKSKASSKLKLTPDHLLLSASLMSNNESICTLRCLLKRNANGQLNVETNDEKNKRASFMVTHFTLSASL